MSQKLEKKDAIDLARLGRLTAWGGMFAPFAHVWYGMLDKIVTTQGASALAKKVALDQVRVSRAHHLSAAIVWTRTRTVGEDLSYPHPHLTLRTLHFPPFVNHPPDSSRGLSSSTAGSSSQQR
jgi:hypothetical protein